MKIGSAAAASACLCVGVFGAVRAEAKVIDLSNMSDPSGTYEVAFCARPSPGSTPAIPGHIFAAFTHKISDDQIEFKAVGATATDETTGGVISSAWSYFGEPVSGYLKEEKYSAIETNCLTVIVNKEDYDAAEALTEDPLAKMGITPQPGDFVLQAYKLGEEDCIGFVLNVAGVLKPRGLKVPARNSLELPMDYMVRMINAN